jgi:hypothetical protein
MEVLLLLCGLAFVLAVVTVVGHGLWVVIASIFGTFTGEHGREQAPQGKPCTKCGARFGVKGGRCVVCGAVPGVSPASTLREELTTTARQLRRLLDRGAITSDQYDALSAAIAAELRTPLAGTTSGPGEPAPRPQPQAAPSAAPVAKSESPFAPAQVVDAIVVEEPPASPPDYPFAAPPAQPVAPKISVLPSEDKPVHPLDRPVALPPPRQPSLPARGLAEMLQSFMEESNIRWGEVIAAVLIVVSSVGLVVSLQSKLQAIPYGPASLFALFTLAFHGAGIYTLRRWKLEAVSRVVLIISLLLVPLALSGAVVMSGSGQTQREITDPLFLIAVALGIAAFGWVTWSASSELVGPARWPLTIGILACSFSQIAIQRLTLAGLDFWRLNAVLALPLAGFLLATIGQLVRTSRKSRLARPHVVQTLLVLGTATFALLAPLVLILVRSEPRWPAVARLSPGLSLAAAAILALGLLIHRRTLARNLSAYRTAGTAILVFASVLLLMFVGFTWPDPELLVSVGLINCVVLAILGFVAELPLLYAPAAACAALASVIGLHLTQGRYEPRDDLSLKVVQSLLMGRSALVLTGLVAIVAAIGGFAQRRGRRDDALMLLFSTAGLAVMTLAIAFVSGFVRIEGWPQDPNLAAPILLLFALAALAAGSRLPWPAIPAIGSFLLWTALVQALWLNGACIKWLFALGWLPDRPIFVATLAHGIITAFASLGWLWFSFAKPQLRPAPRFGTTLAIGAALSLGLALPGFLWIWNDRYAWHAVFALLAALGWAALAAAQRWKWAVSGLQTMLALAAALMVASIWRGRLQTTDWLVNEHHILAQLILLGLGAIVWSVIRRATTSRESLRELLHASWPSVDQILLGVGVVALPILAATWAMPQVGWELGFPIKDLGGATLLDESLAGWAGRGWLALAVILTGLVVSLWERVNIPALIGLGVASFAAVWLAAEPFQDQAAAASAVRWAAGIYAVVWGAVFIARDQMLLGAKQLAWLRWDRLSHRRPARTLDFAAPEATEWFCLQPLVFGGLTILVITIVAVAQSASGIRLRGPVDGSMFASMGLTASYAGPLLALVAVLLGYALRERQAAFAMGGSVVFQLAINLAFLLYLTRSPAQPQEVRTIEWLQWNSLAAGAYALIWLGLRRWITPASAPQQTAPRIMLDLQIVVAGATAAMLVLWGGWSIFTHPAVPPPETAIVGHWLSYVALALFLAALAWLAMTGETTLRPAALGDMAIALLAGIVVLVAASVNQLDTRGQWIAYHTLTAGWMVVGALACAGAVIRAALIPPSPLVGEGPGVRGESPFSAKSWSSLLPHHFAAALLAAPLVMLAIRGNWSDPNQPWWSLAAAGGSFLIATVLGLACRSQLYAYASTFLAGLAISLFWFAPAGDTWQFVLFGNMPAFPEGLTLALTAAAGLWLSREIAAQRLQDQSFDARFTGPRVHILALAGMLPLYFLLRLGYAVFYNHPGGWLDTVSGFPGYAALAACATALLGVVVITLLWDRRALAAIPAAFAWGGIAWLLAIGLVPRWLPQIEHRVVATFAALGLHLALAGQLWSYGANLAALGTKLGISDPIGGLSRTARWLPAVTVLLAGLACIADLVFVLALRQDWLRVVAALGPIACAWGVLCLAQEKRREAFQLAALLIAGLAAIYLAWAQIEPYHTTAFWLIRVFRLVMVLAALTFLYGLALPRWLFTSGSWNAATRKAGYLAGAAAVAAFVATLALEVALFVPGVNTAAVSDAQVAAVAVVLLLLIAGLISLALLPGRDPLMLSETNRQAYVYAAQVVAALLFAHLYVCRPLWFDGILRPYWPFIVMGLAFIGVGAGEWFQRWGVRVLAEPLTRTGALLPLLPVIGIWVVGRTDDAQILLVAGLLYLAISYTRQSWAAMIAAALAGNGALWALLVDLDFDFAAHPQFWLIPPAVSALIAAQVNRHRLKPEMLTTIRYAATIVIYVSSTSEIFIRGIGDSLWQPMALLVLAVAGALAGIALRVRAFLFLGTAFTVLALVAMVAHAAQAIAHVWPWFVLGISLGIGILVLLGVFQKKRDEVLLLISRLKQWEQ